MKEKYTTRFWLEIGDATLDGIDRITEKNKNKHYFHSIPLKFNMKRWMKVRNYIFISFLDIIHIQETRSFGPSIRFYPMMKIGKINAT